MELASIKPIYFLFGEDHFTISSAVKAITKKVEPLLTSDFDKEKTTKTLSLLGELENSNVVLKLKTPQQLQFIYGKSKNYTKLLLFVDDNQSFKTKVEELLSR